MNPQKTEPLIFKEIRAETLASDGIKNRFNKIAKDHGIEQRRTYVKEIKQLRLACRHLRHPKKKVQARRALMRLRTIARVLIRELRRKLPQHYLFEYHPKDFLL
jgi:IS5 family transposase